MTPDFVRLAQSISANVPAAERIPFLNALAALLQLTELTERAALAAARGDHEAARALRIPALDLADTVDRHLAASRAAAP
jgi:hypothetical protein